MATKKKIFGQKGEDKAEEFLQAKGYKILGRNIQLRYGEIDILAQHKKDLIIVEVKTKSSDDFGAPQEEIDYFKQKKLIQLAKSLWQKNPRYHIRIDIIGIDESQDKIIHLINAVEEKN